MQLGTAVEIANAMKRGKDYSLIFSFYDDYV